MVSKFFFLLALVLFVVLAVAEVSGVNLMAWGLAAVAAGLLTEGYFDGFGRR